MTDWDLEALISCTKRPGMYVFDIDIKNGINTFLLGYHIGSKLKCDLGGQILELVAVKNEIPITHEGFVKRIERLSKKRKEEWLTTFQSLANEVLIIESDAEGKSRYANIIRKHFLECLSDFPEKFNLNWLGEWGRRYKQMKEWQGKSLTKTELELIDKIEKRIKKDLWKNPQALDEKKIPVDKSWHLEFEKLKNNLQDNLNEN